MYSRIQAVKARDKIVQAGVQTDLEFITRDRFNNPCDRSAEQDGITVAARLGDLICSEATSFSTGNRTDECIIQDTLKGTYWIRFKLYDLGKINLTVSMNGNRVSNPPVELDVKSPRCALKCILTGFAAVRNCMVFAVAGKMLSTLGTSKSARANQGFVPCGTKAMRLSANNVRFDNIFSVNSVRVSLFERLLTTGDEGTYLDRGLCKPCFPGTKSNKDRTTCEQCPEGTWTFGEDVRCRHCEGPLVQLVSARSSNNKECACKAGYSKSNGGSDVKPDCQPCPANTIKTNDTECEPCGEGKQPNLERTACKPCPDQMWTFGNKVERGLCTTCQGLHSKFAKHNPKQCECDVGYHKDKENTEYSSVNPMCTKCSANTINECTYDRECRKVEECKPCMAGTVPDSNRTVCKQCAEEDGLQTWTFGDSGKCQSCKGGQDSKTNVPIVQFSLNTLSCECIAGYRKITPVKDPMRPVCEPCSTPNTIKTGKEDCKPCNQGEQPNKNRTICEPCEPGMWTFENNGLCKRCEGQSRFQKAVRPNEAPRCECRPGTRKVGGTNINPACTECSAKNTILNCQPCTGGKISNKDRTACIKCAQLSITKVAAAGFQASELQFSVITQSVASKPTVTLGPNTKTTNIPLINNSVQSFVNSEQVKLNGTCVRVSGACCLLYILCLFCFEHLW